MNNTIQNTLISVGGAVAFFVGLILAPMTIRPAVGGTAKGLESYNAFQGIVDLIPELFTVGLISIGLGAMIGGLVRAYSQGRVK